VAEGLRRLRAVPALADVQGVRIVWLEDSLVVVGCQVVVLCCQAGSKSLKSPLLEEVGRSGKRGMVGVGSHGAELESLGGACNPCRCHSQERSSWGV